MSLINEVLNDLDKRKGGEVKKEIGNLKLTQTKKPKCKCGCTKWIIAIIVVVALVVVIGFGIKSFHKEGHFYLHHGHPSYLINSHIAKAKKALASKEAMFAHKKPVAAKVPTIEHEKANTHKAIVAKEEASIKKAVPNEDFTIKEPKVVKKVAKSRTVEVPATIKPAAIKTVAKPITKSERITNVYDKAIAMIKIGEYKKATAVLNKLISEYPENAKARKMLVVLLLRQGNVVKAKHVLKQSLELMPSEPYFIMLQAKFLMMEHKYGHALDLLTGITPDMEKYPSFYTLLALIYQKSGNDMLAAHIYYELTTLDSAKGSWWLGLGLSLKGAGHDYAADEAFKNALKCTDLSYEVRAYINKLIKH